ncbi:hypothetical protein FHS55_003370 [Angulomicrobium tetraedrale]|uniref:Uncharacterized protein n=1 Tax=Ancylobacter tetraedralis TaxID=217068 RepID=A0A839ZDC4_9HYPH|nr:hypothetical protein [Ancylobacter tetraedralis]MBB3772749.1 hypothetical protein [Ancylobacter tetraedralis]
MKAVTAAHGWAQFWDMKGFSGERALPKNPANPLEIALLVDGVAPDKI